MSDSAMVQLSRADCPVVAVSNDFKEGRSAIQELTPLSETLNQLTRVWSNKPAPKKVERPFFIVNKPFSHRKTRFKELARNTLQIVMLFGLVRLVLATRRILGSLVQKPSATWEDPRQSNYSVNLWRDPVRYSGIYRKRRSHGKCSPPLS